MTPCLFVIKKGDKKKLVELFFLTLLHSERPKLYAILAILSAIGLRGTTL